MRIVETDNFGRDYPDEKFVLGCMPKDAAEAIAEVINAHLCDRRYWKVVPDCYVLEGGFEP